MKKYTLEKLNEIMKRNGGKLDLRGCTGLITLPENLTVGESLYLSGCKGLTALPKNLTVGEAIYWGDSNIKNKMHYKEFKNGQYVDRKYIYCDNILTHVKRARAIGKYTYYIGKIKGRNVIYDGENYAHCETFKSGVQELEFKKAKDRGAEQYKGLSLDTVLTVPEAVTMYRIITGACKQYSEMFVNSVKNIKETYTLREVIEKTRGQYNASIFENFFRSNHDCRS